MNRTFLTAVMAITVCFSAAQVFGQAPGSARPASSSQTAPNVPISKIAVVYAEAFQDSKTGIARFTVMLNKLNAEFQKVQDDLTQTAQRLRLLQDEITKLQQAGSATPAQVQTKIDSLDQQKRDYTRKGEDAKAQYQKRYQDLFLPLQDDVTKALNEYARNHGISLIIDGSQVPILYAAESMDVTRAFIADYNSRNPVTAQVQPPK